MCTVRIHSNRILCFISGPTPNSPQLSVANAGNAPSPAMTASTCSNASSQLWKTRLTNIKNSFLGSPRFHRRKLQGMIPPIWQCVNSNQFHMFILSNWFALTVSSDEVYLTPDSSPELTKRSWFGNLMTTEKDETFTVLVKGKPLATVKAHLIHAFLSVITQKIQNKHHKSYDVFEWRKRLFKQKHQLINQLSEMNLTLFIHFFFSFSVSFP